MTKVLIVEDEKDLREVYALILRSQGYEVVTANNGQEGVRAVVEHRPSLVILDILMPVMDGRDFLKNLNLGQYPAMKIIVCSNNSEGTLREEMLGLGAHEVVLKASLAPNDLLRLVAAFVQLSSAADR